MSKSKRTEPKKVQTFSDSLLGKKVLGTVVCKRVVSICSRVGFLKSRFQKGSDDKGDLVEVERKII